MRPKTTKPEKFPKWIIPFYLLGILFAAMNYTSERNHDGSLSNLAFFPGLAFFLTLLSIALALGSLWFWRWRTAKILILMLFLNSTAAFLVTCIANRQWHAELKHNQVYAESFVPRIETYQKAHGQYPASWADLGLTNAPIVPRGDTLIDVEYFSTTNAYSLSLPYGWYRYTYNPTNHQWGAYE